MAERLVEAQKVHFDASKMTFMQYTSVLKSSVKELKRELASALSRLVVLTDNLKEFLASLGEGANSEGQVKSGAI